MRTVPVRRLGLVSTANATVLGPTQVLGAVMVTAPLGFGLLMLRLMAYGLLAALGLAALAVVLTIVALFVLAVVITVVAAVIAALVQVVADRRQVHPDQAMMYPSTPTQEEP